VEDRALSAVQSKSLFLWDNEPRHWVIAAWHFETASPSNLQGSNFQWRGERRPQTNYWFKKKIIMKKWCLNHYSSSLYLTITST